MEAGEAVVGRQRELEALTAALGRMRHGLHACVLGGPAGMGKTTLWRRGLELARRGEAALLVTRPAEAEARLSYAGLADLLEGVAQERFERLPAVQRESLEVALLKRAAGEGGVDPRAVASGLLSLLRDLCAETPVVVAVDDAQWLDASTASALAYALRRLEERPVGVLASVRTGAQSPQTFVDALPAERRTELPLPPLSVAAIHSIVRSELGWTPPRPTLVRIAKASGGNPLYALEIARLIDRHAPEHAAEVPVPESLSSLVLARVRSLPGPTRDALLRAAALARPSLSLVDAESLAAAEDAGLVRVGDDGRIEFAHPLFAAAVYSSASVSSRRRMHRALVDVVTDAEERARHLALACDGPDEEVARTVEAAALQARIRGAPLAAAELNELALRLTPEGAAGADERRLRLAESLQLAGDYQRAAALLEELRDELAPGDMRARAVLALAEIDYWRKGDPEGLALAEEALAAACDPIVRARCQTAIAEYAGTVDVPKAAAGARDALELLETLPAAGSGLLSAALGARVRADLFLGEGLDLESAERALVLEAGSPRPGVDTRIPFKLGQWLRYVDDLDGARVRLAEAEQAARAEGDESSVANILLNRVALETWAGDWTTAATLTERMAEAFEQVGVDPQLVPWTVYVAAHAGDVPLVRAAAERARPGEAMWSRCLGLAELAAGDVAAADRHLSFALAELERVGFREPAIWRVEGDAVEAALGAGDLAGAAELTARFEERAARSRIPWSLAVSARCRGLVLAAGGDLEGAAEALARAAAEHGRCPVPFERARTLLHLGRVQLRRRRKRAARLALEEALGLFETLGAPAWADRARAEPTSRAPPAAAPRAR